MGIECIIGIKFDNFVMMAADMSHISSIMVHKSDCDKMQKLSSHLLMGIVGESGDTTQFGEYVEKNVQLYKMRNGYELPPAAAVHFTRNTLASHLRSREPYAVNLLVGGFDPVDASTSLHYIDYLAAGVPVKYYAFGYGGMFTLSVMDREYRPDMTQDEAYELMRKCASEIKRRFLANLPQFRVRVIAKDGISDLPHITAEGLAH